FASGDACVVTDAAYQPRNPEESLLYQVKLWLASWKPFWRPNRITSGRCRASSRRSFDLFSIVACSPGLPPDRLQHLQVGPRRLASGRLAYRMKTPWRNGTTHVIMSDGQLVEKLAALVPAPRFQLVRYFGILAS